MDTATPETTLPPTHLKRLVKLAKLVGARLEEGQRGYAENWLAAVERIYDRDGGRSGFAGPLLTETMEGLGLLVRAGKTEADAANARLSPAARARYAAEATSYRSRIEGILYQRETQLANQRDAVRVEEAQVLFQVGTPFALVDEVLAAQNLVAAWEERVTSADLTTVRAPVRTIDS